MTRLEELQAKRVGIRSGANEIISQAEKITNESYRVAEVAHNAPIIIKNLDEEFEKKTGLKKKDFPFIFLATGLQCLRQYLLPNDFNRISHDKGDKLVKDGLKIIIPQKVKNKKDIIDILTSSVPYDATNLSDNFQNNFPEVSTGLSGFTHRYRTLGHDPVLGWIFGPANILTDALTKSNFIETYSVVNMKIDAPYKSFGGISTFGMFSDFYNIVSENDDGLKLLVISIIRQIIHFGSDYFTKQGLPVPIIPSINNDLSGFLTTQCNIDFRVLVRGITLSALINKMVEIMYKLIYANDFTENPALLDVKTRKVITVSNVIATSSNILVVGLGTAIGSATGNAKMVSSSLKKFDIGGFIVTIHRLISDKKFISEIKQEFILNNFDKMIQGDM